MMHVAYVGYDCLWNEEFDIESMEHRYEAGLQREHGEVIASSRCVPLPAANGKRTRNTSKYNLLRYTFSRHQHRSNKWRTASELAEKKNEKGSANAAEMTTRTSDKNNGEKK